MSAELVFTWRELRALFLSPDATIDLYLVLPDMHLYYLIVIFYLFTFSVDEYKQNVYFEQGGLFNKSFQV